MPIEPTDGVPNAGNLLRDVIADAGGVSGLRDRFERAGLADRFGSWTASGPNLPVTAGDIERVVPADRRRSLAAAHGLPVDSVPAILAVLLPHAVEAATTTAGR